MISASLGAVVEEYRAKGVPAIARHGGVQDHLPDVLQVADGMPLLLFLDPCGALIPFEVLAGLLAGPRRAQRPPTEVLLNFSAGLTRRSAGALYAGQRDHDGIVALNVACGGDWWQDVAMDARRTATNFEAAAEAVATEYARRLGKAAGARHVAIPVRKRQHQQPIYHLVFCTRSPYGQWVFGASVASARQVWLRHLGDDDSDQSETLFGDRTESAIGWEQERAQAQVERNLQELLTGHRPFRLVDYAAGVLADVYGVATEETVKNAVLSLERRRHLRVLSLDQPSI
ncbi:MAG TPA: three-Cys-motif partner protein TcmP [Pseudonocardia sp.]|jgi:three-Cys-motif partner protein|nr:three-Cys-motif partner protein TcmP [Pseudonocardia sp.]